VAIASALVTSIGIIPEIAVYFEFFSYSSDITWAPVIVCFVLDTTVGSTVQVALETIFGVSVPIMIFWIGDRLFEGTAATVMYIIFTTFMIAFLPFGKQLRRWAMAYTLSFFAAKFNGTEQTATYGIVGLQLLTIACVAITVCLILSVAPYPRSARVAAQDNLTALSETFVELMNPLSDAFCEPLKHGYYRKKLTRRTQNAFVQITAVERYLAEAWYEAASYSSRISCAAACAHSTSS
jgi:hypothetical protein